MSYSNLDQFIASEANRAEFGQFLQGYHHKLAAKFNFPPLKQGKALHAAAEVMGYKNWHQVAAGSGQPCAEDAGGVQTDTQPISGHSVVLVDQCDVPVAAYDVTLIVDDAVIASSDIDEPVPVRQIAQRLAESLGCQMQQVSISSKHLARTMGAVDDDTDTDEWAEDELIADYTDADLINAVRQKQGRSPQPPAAFSMSDVLQIAEQFHSGVSVADYGFRAALEYEGCGLLANWGRFFERGDLGLFVSVIRESLKLFETRLLAFKDDVQAINKTNMSSGESDSVVAILDGLLARYQGERPVTMALGQALSDMAQHWRDQLRERDARIIFDDIREFENTFADFRRQLEAQMAVAAPLDH